MTSAVERVRAMCDGLPEITVRADDVTHTFEVRRRVVAYVADLSDPGGAAVTIVVLNADADERHALLATGHPFFAPGSGRNRLGIVVDDETDWGEVHELVVDSYRLVAPKKLTALLDD